MNIIVLVITSFFVCFVACLLGRLKRLSNQKSRLRRVGLAPSRRQPLLPRRSERRRQRDSRERP